MQVSTLQVNRERLVQIERRHRTAVPHAPDHAAAPVPCRERRRRFQDVAVCVLLATALCTAGCTRTTSQRGIEPVWRALPADALIVGQTTQSTVLELLGPPSQVITHDSGQIFYYLHELSTSRGLILVVYNKSETDTSYDRAIFFFDTDGLLVDYAISAPARPAK